MRAAAWRRVTAALLAGAAFCAAAQPAEPAAVERALRAAVLEAEAAPGADGQRLIEAMTALGDQIAAQGRMRDAIAQWRRTLETVVKWRGLRHLDVVASLQRLARLHAGLGEHEEAVGLFDRSVRLLESLLGADHQLVGIALSNRAVAQRGAGRYEEAAADYTRALAIMEARFGPDDPQVAVTLGNLAVLELTLARYAQALALLERSTAIIEKRLGPDHPDLAVSLINLASLHDLTGSPAQALPLLRRGLMLSEARFGPRSAEVASILGNLGGTLKRLDRYDEALEAMTRSLEIRESRSGADHPDVALSLNNLSTLHAERGDLVQALETMRRSLAISERRLAPDEPGLATKLGNMAALHAAFGQYQQAIELERRGLALTEKRLDPEHPDVAAALSALGVYHVETGDLAAAQPLFERSLAIREKRLGPNHRLVAYALNNLAALHIEHGRPAEALPLLSRARSLLEAQAAASDQEVATGLNNEAAAYFLAGDAEQAARIFRRGISRAQTGGAREVLWKLQSGLGTAHARLGQADAAIVWGKEAVNTLQALRGELQSAERGLQISYLQSRRAAYDQLADLLIAQGRIPEAQAVLQMLKEQELHEGLERAEPVDPRSTRIDLTGLERERFARYYELRDGQTALGAERRELERKARDAPLSAAEAQRLKRIVEELMPVAEAAMQAFFSQLERELAEASAAGAAPVARDTSRLRLAVDALARSEPQARAVGVQYLVTEERLSIVLSLPGTPPIAYQQPIGRRRLHEAIARVLAQLRHPRADAALYGAGLRELHGWLIGPIESDLRRWGARTLMLSLDDQLRLLPFAALLDARGRHLIEDYTPALYNEAARQALDRPGAVAWRVAAMGLSEAVDGLPALAAVPQELQGIVGARGVAGDAYLNGAFDRARLFDTLQPGERPYNVLHVASHFVFQPGLPGQSRLYLGDKSRLTLADIAREDMRFGNFDLVAFSACDSAKGGGRGGDGREMESLGAKAQNQGAQAVLATLWKVDDASTAAFMRGYYDGRGVRRSNKAEALREVQLAMLQGRLGGEAGWRAPMHWAPFVLMGNWR